MRVREAADYNSTYDKDAAADVVDTAGRTFETAKEILRK